MCMQQYWWSLKCVLLVQVCVYRFVYTHLCVKYKRQYQQTKNDKD